jgi:hypothetical protein
MCDAYLDPSKVYNLVSCLHLSPQLLQVTATFSCWKLDTPFWDLPYDERAITHIIRDALDLVMDASCVANVR